MKAMIRLPVHAARPIPWGRGCIATHPTATAGTSDMTAPITSTPVRRCRSNTPDITTDRSTSSGRSLTSQRSVSCARAGAGLAKRGFKIVSRAHPVNSIITALAMQTGATCAQPVPGTRAKVIAMENPNGDQQRVEAKPRWIATIMRRVRMRRISSSGSRARLSVASDPRSEIEP